MSDATRGRMKKGPIFGVYRVFATLKGERIKLFKSMLSILSMHALPLLLLNALPMLSQPNGRKHGVIPG